MMQYQISKTLILLTSLVLCASCGNSGDEIAKSYADKKGRYPIVTRHLTEDKEPKFTNNLIKQSSLYLLQHAHNPVNWYAWGDEAFAAAEEQDKPILLSIGYSTCHWCHVMARESFEDIEIANFINEHFIAIKVDREERPDIDELYLTAVQMLSGQAGWPLTAVLTPKGQPFFGGTYFAPDKFQQLLTKIHGTWAERRGAVVEQAERLEKALKNVSKSSQAAKAIDQAVIKEAVSRIKLGFNSYQPGPGFPREPEILFLLNNALATLSSDTINTINQRLRKLAASGLHDQVGGGFHRYTVDADLVIPHFEKMLYNQAQLGQSYFRAYGLTSDNTLKSVGETTFSFMLNEMQSPDGGFYAAMDAESQNNSGEKSEGAFYLWSYDELSSLLSESELALAKAVFGVSLQGNFNGLNVLQNNGLEIRETGQADYSADQITAVLEKLASVRKQRKRPSTDTKIITSWNSMAISALVTGFKTIGNEEYRAAAQKAADRIWEKAYSKSSGLARTLPNGKQRVAGSLEDYAYFAIALLDLYDLHGDPRWLERAEQVAAQMSDRFRDSNGGGFLISSTEQQKSLIVALVTARDDAINSGNSMAAQLFARLYRRTGNTDYRQVTRDVLSTFSKQLLANPESLSGMLVAASLLNEGEIGQTQYAAKAKVTVASEAKGDELVMNISIDDDWHINAASVLSDGLIPTSFESKDAHCATISDIKYPEGERVTLGFQDDELLVYEGSITLRAKINSQTNNDCQLAAGVLNIQACSDEVCQSPESLEIRVLLKNP